MLNRIFKIAIIGLLAAAIVSPQGRLFGQITNKPSAEKKAAPEPKESPKLEKKPGAGPFHGKLAALDRTAKTITVGKRTFQITSATRINKAGKPATLQDGVVGEAVSGYVKPSEDGKLLATTINFGPKEAGKSPEPKKVSAEK